MHYQFDWAVLLQYRGILLDGLVATIALAVVHVFAVLRGRVALSDPDEDTRSSARVIDLARRVT